MTDAYLQHGFKYGYIKPVVGQVYQLEDAAQAHHDVIENNGKAGRLTLKI